jgi:hypothetical protein
VRSLRGWGLAGVVAIVAGGCGSAAHRSTGIATERVAGVTSYAQVAEASCTSWDVNGKPPQASCVYVVADGRRFRCPPRFAHAVQTASSLQHSPACRKIAALHLSGAVRRVTAAIESTQACLMSHRVRAIGNAVLPPLADPSSPDGELIAGYLPRGALIAFYRDSEKAQRLEPAVLQNARHTGAQVQRRGAVTIFWARPPTPIMRRAVQACLPGA